MSKLMLWEDSKAKMGFKESVIPSLILTIGDGENILILAMEGINKQIQVSTVLQGSFNQGNNNLINLNRVRAQHWMKL